MNLHMQNMSNFLIVIRRIYLSVLQQIYLIFEKFSCRNKHCFLRNTPFKFHYIRDVPRDGDAASVSEVHCRLCMSEICFISIFTIVAISCYTGDQIRKMCQKMHD